MLAPYKGQFSWAESISWAKKLTMSGVIWFFICVLCGVLTSRAEDFEGSGATENSSETNSTEVDEEYHLIVGNLSLCGNVADNVFLPFVGDCNRYYLCRSGQAIELQCEWPYQFNANTQSCVKNGQAECLPTCESYSFSTFSYQRTCTKYVLCYYGRPVLRQCQDGLQYNSQTDRCDFAQNVDCVESECSIYYNAYHLRYVPSKVSCDRYFLCGNGIPRMQTCTPGLYFSTKCDCCDIPSKSDCQIPEEQRKLRQFSRLSPRTTDGICPPYGVHFYAHDSRRDSYYYCIDGHGLVLDCSPGLWYDPKVQECREPKNVGL
ncbi:protein obstructor-E [Drosophila takahashii]|uniref:protein obstructor-E n=1 Tax=Drosophila takahashii TaxID=29030 RepID=UPI003898FD39